MPSTVKAFLKNVTGTTESFGAELRRLIALTLPRTFGRTRSLGDLGLVLVSVALPATLRLSRLVVCHLSEPSFV